MQAVVLTEPYKLLYQDMPIPKVNKDGVLIKMVYCGICGSELHAFIGKHPLRMPPVILGHEFSGIISELGADVDKYKVGDAVTVFPLIGCGKCKDCYQGEENLCDDKFILGSQKWPGPFAQYVTAPADRVYLLPREVDFAVGALIEPLAVGLHAVRNAEVTLGDRVAVLGAGTIGLCIALLAAEAGATTVIATDVQSFNLNKALELGATHAFDACDCELLSKVDAVCGGAGCDVVFVAAGAPQLINQGIKMLRKKGKLMVVAMYDEPLPVDIMATRAVEKIITGTKMYLPDDFRRIIDLIATKKIDPRSLITHTFSLKDAAKAFDLYVNRVPGIVKILLKNEDLKDI
ncbi:MAG: alcohol dehydrogenase catalytic domain-containing protein [Dehalobacterium sp.]